MKQSILRIISLAMALAMVISFLIICAIHGMNKTLCARDYTTTQYTEMKLDCANKL